MILHADMDAFYASIEQRDTPKYRGRPIAVGGIGPRGVVSAASYEARPFGVRSAMPTVEARKRCPDLIVIPGDMARYRRESKRVFEIFEEFSPSIEGISLGNRFRYQLESYQRKVIYDRVRRRVTLDQLELTGRGAGGERIRFQLGLEPTGGSSPH